MEEKACLRIIYWLWLAKTYDLAKRIFNYPFYLIVKFLIPTWITADHLSFFRILLAPILVFTLFVQADRESAFWIFAIAQVTDKLDGEIIRQRNNPSKIGGKLDRAADKVVEFVSSSYAYIFNPIFAVAVIVTEIISFASIPFDNSNGRAGEFGKVKTFLRSTAILMLLWPYNYQNFFTTGWQPLYNMTAIIGGVSLVLHFRQMYRQ
jgi:phosphatidylglycerophosphate synthase